MSLFWVLLGLAAGFGLLTLVRIGGAQRAMLARKWPSLVLGVATGLLAWRGLWALALVVAGLAWLAWIWPPPRRDGPLPGESGDAEARRLLGVGPNASADDIRAAYREKMRTAHPDQGGSHALAARLAAARDRLLRTRR